WTTKSFTPECSEKKPLRTGSGSAACLPPSSPAATCFRGPRRGSGCGRSSKSTSAAASWVRSGPGRPGLRRAPENVRSEEHTSELQSRENLVCRLLLEKKKRERKCTQ